MSGRVEAYEGSHAAGCRVPHPFRAFCGMGGKQYACANPLPGICPTTGATNKSEPAT